MGAAFAFIPIQLLSPLLNRQNSLFDVGRSMFDVHFFVNPYEIQFLLRLKWPLFNPADGTSEPLNPER